VTEPTKDQIALARRIVEPRTDHEIRRRMEKLEKIHKGAGYPMYEALKIVLEERRIGKR
jgi:hypothetical protein